MNSPTQSAKRPTRSQQGIPYCWQEKAALRKIRNAFDSSNSVSTALGVYGALSEIASDEQSDQFETTHAWIGQKSGVSSSTAKRRLKVLEEIGLVEIYTPPLHAPSTYRLLAVGHGEPAIGHGELTIGHSRKQVPRPTSEESKKNLKKESKKNRAVALTIPLVLNTPAFLQEWEKWVAFRKTMKKVQDWGALFQGQLDEILSLLPIDQAIQCLKTARLSGWTGLFPDKATKTRPVAQTPTQPIPQFTTGKVNPEDL